LGITTADASSDPWNSWVMAPVIRLGLADLDALSVLCDVPVARLLDWRANSGSERPEIAELLRLAERLQVDTYDLLVAAGWVDPTVS